MLAKSSLTAITILIGTGLVAAWAADADNTTGSTWHPAGEASTSGADAASTPTTEPAAVAEVPSRPITQIANDSTTLPNDHGQVWREYDISSYTVKVTTTKRPEQAIIDWILQETGYEAWHSEPLGVLSADSRRLRVYHTPEMQAVVADLVTRFVDSKAETSTFSLRVATVGHPSWRAKAQRMLRPVSVQTPGVSAWLLAKEDAAMLLAQLHQRSDFRQHSSPYLMIVNGQSTVVSSTRARNYVRSLIPRTDAWPGYEPEMGQIDEGFSLEFGPLISTDRRTIDAVIKCEIDQVEKMVPVVIEVPTTAAPRQRTNIEVPQITHFRFHERFRWPSDQVLLVDMGMVALPVPIDSKPLIPGLPLGAAPTRADLLVFVEAKGKTDRDSRIPVSAQRSGTTYRSRY